MGTGHRWRIPLWATVLSLFAWQLLGSPARAQEVSLQTQTEYRLIETKSADGQVQSSGRLSPFYVLTLRGPMWGGTNVYMDLGMAGYSRGDAVTSVDQRNTRLSLLAQGTRMNLAATLTRDSNRVSVVESGGKSQASLVTAGTSALSALLSYPSYPSLSLQYQRSIVRPPAGEEVEATNRLLAANYAWGPFRFTADDAQQQAALSQSSSRTRAYGVSFDQSALPSVRLSVDHYLTSAELTARGRAASSSSHVTRARLSTLPTPFLTLDADLAVLASTQGDNGGRGESFTGQERSLSLRSEVLPGIRLDASTRSQLSRSQFGETRFRQLAGNLAAQVLPTTDAVASWSRSTAEDRLSGRTGGQTSRELSVASQLSPLTELSVSYARAARRSAGSQQETVSAGIGIRRQLDQTLSVGAAFFQHRQDVTSGSEHAGSRTQTVQLDATWLPAVRWGLRFGLGLARSEDDSRQPAGQAPPSGDTRLSLTPSLDLRWETDPATTVVLRYDLRRIREDIRQEGAIIGSTSNTGLGLTGRLTHLLANGGTLEVVYDYQKGFLGPVVWQKTLSVQYARAF